jgi:hypothetical protein
MSAVVLGVAGLLVAPGCSDQEPGLPSPPPAQKIQTNRDVPPVQDREPADLPTDTGQTDDRQPREVAGEKRDAETPEYLSWVTKRPITFGQERRENMADYSFRHYGEREWRLTAPKQIVQHFAVAGSLDSIFNTFRPNTADPSYGELPNVCTHFAVSEKGEVIQMVPLGTRCRHVVGLNHVSIGIEHVGFSDEEVLDNPKMMSASLRLTNDLRCRYGIAVSDVIGHNESLESRFYLERVEYMKGQTHGDFTKESMDRYRGRLQQMGPCPAS